MQAGLRPDGIIARAMDAPRARAASFRYADVSLFVACVAVACVAALRLQQDANWDLQNYHFYDPWAWLTGRIFDRDIAAAQLQTFHNPLADVPFYALVAAGVDPRVVTSWLALPAGIAAYFFVKIAWLLFADLRTAQRVGATAAAAFIGFTGAMGVGQLGSTTDEWLVTAFTMAALWLLVRETRSSPAQRPAWALALAGVLMGIASGLKLTAATYAVGLCAALIATDGRRGKTYARPRFIRAASPGASRSRSVRGATCYGSIFATRSFPTATNGSARPGGICTRCCRIGSVRTRSANGCRCRSGCWRPSPASSAKCRMSMRACRCSMDSR